MFLNIRDEKSKVKNSVQCLYKAPMGFEPMTSCLLDRRSNQLSYGAPRFTASVLFTHVRSRSEALRTPRITTEDRHRNIIFERFRIPTKYSYKPV